MGNILPISDLYYETSTTIVSAKLGKKTSHRLTRMKQRGQAPQPSQNQKTIHEITQSNTKNIRVTSCGWVRVFSWINCLAYKTWSRKTRRSFSYLSVLICVICVYLWLIFLLWKQFLGDFGDHFLVDRAQMMLT